MRSDRLAPRPAPFPERVETTLRRLMGGSGQEPLALFRTIAHHEELLDRFRGVGATLLAFGRLPPRERELVIHRTTARCGAAYEWGVHATIFAPQVGGGDAWLVATWSGTSDDPAFTPRERLLVRMCDELHDTATLTDATWTELRDAYADDALVELVILAGFYHLVSCLCGAFAIAPESWAKTPPV